MIYPLGTTLTHELTFMNNEEALSDIDQLVEQIFLGSRANQLGEDKEIDPVAVRVSTGKYHVNYTIPTDIDTDKYKEMTFIYTGHMGPVKKVATKTIQIDWR